MKIWVDIAHPPHALFFAPVVRRLLELDHEVILTARDSPQTVELARERWPDVAVVGGPSPKGKVAKAHAIVARMHALRRWARRARPDLALSHNSYAQIAAARSLRVRSVTTMDYEHQPANHLAFRLADAILLPTPVPLSDVQRQGARARKVRRYPGLKEELYIGDFSPNPGVLDDVGIARGGKPVVVMRAPPATALYHAFENPLWEEVVREFDRGDVITVVLARTPQQREFLQRFPTCVAPGDAVDSRALMYEADLVVGAGGTMTREAAVLGIPTASIYRGPPAAVDTWLESQGRLQRVTTVDQLLPVSLRPRAPQPIETLRSRGNELLELFVGEVLAAARP